MEHVSRRFRVTGKVQGVFFRQSTCMQAHELSVRGHARNLPDGSVEIVAHGAVPAVEALHRWLHRGPRSARVDGVAELAIEADTAPPEGFKAL